MRPAAFDDLTPAGRVRRLRRLVPGAMAHHDVGVARVRLAADAFNTTFRIEARNGRRYALRVAAPWHLNADGIAEVEAVWAAALAADTPVAPPQVVRTRDGAASVSVEADGVPGARECVLFRWQEGPTLHGRLHDHDLVAGAGEVLAIMHAHAAGFDGVRDGEVLRADRVCYFRLPDRLTARDALFAEGMAWAQEVLDRVWRERGAAAHLLHGDFYPRNLLVRHGRVVPIDFQDATWGPEEVDVAITLVMLDHDDPSGAAAAALQRGYERHRTWPLGDPAVRAGLTIARRLQLANLQRNVRPAATSPFVDDLARDLRRLLRG
jgi:Ser/Thr protein kinase RdoA (MazF antagonist)